MELTVTALWAAPTPTTSQLEISGYDAVITIDPQWDETSWTVTDITGDVIASSNGSTTRTVFGAMLECENAIHADNAANTANIRAAAAIAAAAIAAETAALTQET